MLAGTGQRSPRACPLADYPRIKAPPVQALSIQPFLSSHMKEFSGGNKSFCMATSPAVESGFFSWLRSGCRRGRARAGVHNDRCGTIRTHRCIWKCEMPRRAILSCNVYRLENSWACNVAYSRNFEGIHCGRTHAARAALTYMRQHLNTGHH